MKNKTAFHGSDLEKVANYYHIPQEEILSFSANVNPLGLSSTVEKKLADHLDLITRYPDRDYTSLKEAIASYTGCSEEQVIVGNGVTELISLLIAQCAPKEALILGPTYSEYERELSLVGGKCVAYDLQEAENFHLDTADFLAHLTDHTGLVILCNPNNPTSSALETAQLEEILKACRDKGIFVLIDETYVEFAPDPQKLTAISLTKSYENCMVLRGVSKFFAAPGIRFGYGMTGNQSLLTAMLARQNPWSLNSLGAYAGELLLQDSIYIKESKALIDAERQRVMKALSSCPKFKCYPVYANFALLQILKEGCTAQGVFETAIHEKMMIRDCSSFSSLNGEFIRFCFRTQKQDDQLLQCLLSI